VSVAPAPGFNVENWLPVALFIALMLATVVYAMRSKVKSAKEYYPTSRDSNWPQIGT
jgi:hypothetical protein